MKSIWFVTVSVCDLHNQYFKVFIGYTKHIIPLAGTVHSTHISIHTYPLPYSHMCTLTKFTHNSYPIHKHPLPHSHIPFTTFTQTPNIPFINTSYHIDTHSLLKIVSCKIDKNHLQHLDQFLNAKEYRNIK